ncbi:MAG TPA: hypothetical protein VKU01_33560 [Bryobacteraceae bacterium]|nr:hypothetical protein [Bryobacteraceae bacterium]
MDKARHPHVVRTWTVERTKVHYRPPQPANLRQDPRQGFLRTPEKKPNPPGSPPKTGQ